MSQLLLELFGTFARALVVFLAGTMVSHKIWTEDEAIRFTAYLVPIATSALAALALALYQRYRSRVAVQTALDMPRGSTPEELKAKLADGTASSVFRRPTGLLFAAALSFVMVAPTGCSLSSKGKVVTGYEATQTGLEGVQDALKAAYDSKAVPELTPAVYAKAQRALAAAFDAQEKLAGPLKAWRAGDPVPQGYQQWVAAIEDTLAALEPIVPKSNRVFTAAVAWSKTALSIFKQLGTSAPERLQVLAANP